MGIRYFLSAKLYPFFAVFIGCTTFNSSAEETVWPVTFGDENVQQKQQKTSSQASAESVKRNPLPQKSHQPAKTVTAAEEPRAFPAVKPAVPSPATRSVTFSSPAAYSSSGQVSLWDAAALAVKWHPIIKRAEQELAQSQEAINEAEAGWLPSLNAGVKSGLEENEYSGRNEGSSAVVLSASQVLYDFGKTEGKVELANSSATYQASSLNNNISEIVYETVNNYLQAIRYQRLADIAEKQVAGFSLINDIARKRASMGASAQSDYSQSKVRLASAVASQHDYQAQANRWSAALDSITNKAVSQRLNKAFPDGMDGICRNTSIDNITSPAIAMARAQVEMAKDKLASAKADYYPTLSLEPSYEYQLDSTSTSSARSGKKGYWGVFVNVSVPLFEGGAQVSRARQSESVLKAAQYDLDRSKTDAIQKVNESTSQISSMGESLKAKKTREGEAVQTRDLYKMQYIELGTRSFSDLLTAESEIHQTRMDIVNQSYTMTSLSVDCLYYSGQLASYFVATRK